MRIVTVTVEWNGMKMGERERKGSLSAGVVSVAVVIVRCPVTVTVPVIADWECGVGVVVCCLSILDYLLDVSSGCDVVDKSINVFVSFFVPSSLSSRCLPHQLHYCNPIQDTVASLYTRRRK